MTASAGKKTDIKRWRLTFARRLAIYRHALQVLSGMAGGMPYNTALEEKIAWEQFSDSLLEREKKLFSAVVFEGKAPRGEQRKDWERTVFKYVRVYGEEV